MYRLKKPLYEFKQALNVWYGRIDSFLMSLGFTKSKANSNLYYNVEDDGIMILLFYVEYLFLVGKEKFVAKFKIKDLA